MITFSHSFVDVKVLNKTPYQGDAVWVIINTPKKIKAGTIKFGKNSFKIFKKKNQVDTLSYVSCIGISRYSVPGQKSLTITLNFSDGSTYDAPIKLNVLSSNFKKEYITLKPKKNKLAQNRTQLRNENKIIGRGFKTKSLTRLFDGSFALPLEGRVSSEFGVQRVYNNRPSWSHSGIDIAAKKGTPISATQHGTILLADSFDVHGKTVMIDHGWGLVSIYNHLSKINVKSTDKVHKGAIIGYVGSTGISTGDHLHFGVSVQGVRVDPKRWIQHSSQIQI